MNNHNYNLRVFVTYNYYLCILCMVEIARSTSRAP